MEFPDDVSKLLVHIKSPNNNTSRTRTRTRTDVQFHTQKIRMNKKYNTIEGLFPNVHVGGGRVERKNMIKKNEKYGFREFEWVKIKGVKDSPCPGEYNKETTFKKSMKKKKSNLDKSKRFVKIERTPTPGRYEVSIEGMKKFIIKNGNSPCYSMSLSERKSYFDGKIDIFTKKPYPSPRYKTGRNNFSRMIKKKKKKDNGKRMMIVPRIRFKDCSNKLENVGPLSYNVKYDNILTKTAVCRFGKMKRVTQMKLSDFVDNNPTSSTTDGGFKYQIKSGFEKNKQKGYTFGIKRIEKKFITPGPIYNHTPVKKKRQLHYKFRKRNKKEIMLFLMRIRSFKTKRKMQPI